MNLIILFEICIEKFYKWISFTYVNFDLEIYTSHVFFVLLMIGELDINIFFFFFLPLNSIPIRKVFCFFDLSIYPYHSFFLSYPPPLSLYIYIYIYIYIYKEYRKTSYLNKKRISIRYFGRIKEIWELVSQTGYSRTRSSFLRAVLLFGLVLSHINHCRLFNAKPSLYVYIK